MEKKLLCVGFIRMTLVITLASVGMVFQSTTIRELGVSDLIAIHKELSSYLYKYILNENNQSL